MIELKPGKEYKTRSDKIAKIQHKEGKYFKGVLDGKPIYYTPTGLFVKHKQENEHRLDIVEEVTPTPPTPMSNKTEPTAEVPKEIEISLKLHRYISGKLVEYLDRYRPNHAIKASNAYFDGYAEGYLDAESRLDAIAGEVEELPHIDEIIFEEYVKEDGSFSGKKRRAVLVELPKVLEIINRNT